MGNLRSRENEMFVISNNLLCESTSSMNAIATMVLSTAVYFSIWYGNAFIRIFLAVGKRKL